jgi:ABC-type sugar transport system ATPase subunit
MEAQRAAPRVSARHRGRPAVARVALRNITKQFGALQIFQGLDLDIADGELLCLLDPSGSGKTTLLRIIAGLEKLDSGEIWVGDREISTLPPRRRHLGMMFQGYALYPHLSVRENLAYPLRVRHVRRSECAQRITEVARLLGIERLLDRRIQQISGGEQQRVAIGRAIVQKPNAYLLDEPIGNLDASLRESVRTELRRLQRRLSSTMIMVTHDQFDALEIADRIAIPRAGVLQQCGTPQELYWSPANLFVAGFIGRTRMNLLAGRYDRAGSSVRHCDGFELPIGQRAAAELPAAAAKVVVGLRTEALELRLTAAAGTIPGTVEAVHFQGEIAVPLARPAILAVGLLAFIFSWNEFFFAVIPTRAEVTTLPFILPTLMEGHNVLWGDIAAIATIAAMPVIIIAFILQKYLVRGLSFGTLRE